MEMEIIRLMPSAWIFLKARDENVAALSTILAEKYSGKSIKARQLFEEHQVSTQFAGQHYLKTLRYMVDIGKVTANFTDGKNHKVNVLLTDHCELSFN